MKKNTVKKIDEKLLLFIFMIILPILLVHIGHGNWINRIIASSISISCGMFFCLYVGLSPNYKIIKKDGKLNNKEYSKIRPRVEFAIRIIILCVGLTAFWFLLLPQMKDVYRLIISKQDPEILRGIVENVSTGPGALFICKSVEFKIDSGETIKRLYMYPSRSVKLGKEYDFVILPQSKFILEVK